MLLRSLVKLLGYLMLKWSCDAGLLSRAQFQIHYLLATCSFTYQSPHRLFSSITVCLCEYFVIHHLSLGHGFETIAGNATNSSPINTHTHKFYKLISQIAIYLCESFIIDYKYMPGLVLTSGNCLRPIIAHWLHCLYVSLLFDSVSVDEFISKWQRWIKTVFS